MKRQFVLTAAVFALATLISGCSVMGAASTGLSVGKNLKSNRLGIRVWLDGHEAKRNELKQAATGYSRWKIKEDVSTTPTLRFEFKDPGALGRIRSVNVQIHQKFEADYSDQAEFVVYASDTSPEGQMKPNVDYPLGSPGSDVKVMNWKSQPVGGVQLEPGKEYMMVISVSADDSESAQIFFTTK